MFIDIKNLTPNVPIDFEFNKELEIPSVPPAKACVCVKGTVSGDKGIYGAKGEIEAILDLNCDLCLKAFKSSIKLDLDEVYATEANIEEDFWQVLDKMIDIEPAVIGNILLNIPRRVVCDDNCKGLCPICGQNLNDAQCSCDRGYINPQFEMLKGLFGD